MRYKFLLSIFLCLLGTLCARGQTIGGQLSGAPLLPQLVPSVVFPPDTGYVHTTVANGANLQTAITAAACGTKLLLAANGSFSKVTAYTLPNTTCACHTDPSKWIIIQSDDPSYTNGSIRGTRIDPSVEYTKLAHISSSDTNYTFQVTNNGTGCYWFGPGLDVTETTNLANAVISWGDGSFSTANYPHDMVFDHSYCHGLPTTTLVRCLMLNGNFVSVVDSYLSDAHKPGQDTQAIESWDGFGPYLYQNNFLEGAGENTMFGGAASQPGSLVSDITIQQNHYFKPLAWRLGDPTYLGIHYVVKDSVEFKSAQRVLFTGNVVDQDWTDGQHELEIFNTGCSGSNPSVNYIQDVTQYFNIWRHGPQGPVFGGCNDIVNQPLHRVSFHDELWYDLDNCIWWDCSGGYGHSQLFYSPALPNAQTAAYDLWLNHETFAINTNMISGIFVAGNPGEALSKFYGIKFTNSIVGYGGSVCPSGCQMVAGNGVGGGNGVITNYWSGAAITNNCVYGTGDGNSYTSPSFNNRQTPANQAAVFVDPGVDFHVSGSSVCHNAASDGSDMGADINAVNAATAGVVRTLGNLHTVTNVSPSTFTNLGGTGITITGTNFISESGLGVIIGGAGPAVAETSNSCGFASPGQFTVTAVADTTHFIYTGACVVVTSSPITLAVNDTINVTVNSALTGGNVNRYTPGNACTSVSVVSATSITCTTPAATGTVTNGPVSVFVSQFGIPVQSTVFGNYN